MSKRFDPVSGAVIPVFFHYAVPSVIGMLAISSAGIIDGIFIGNYVGAAALAAVNISMPALYASIAMVFMLAVGGSVMCGKFLGENDLDSASSIFSKTVYFMLLLGAVVALSTLVLLDQFVDLLGANESLEGMVGQYLGVLLYSMPVFVLALTLDYFVRIDGRPVLASAGLVAVALVNVALDWLFIVEFEWGLAGAAAATVLSWACLLFILLSHWLGQRYNIKLVRVPMRWRNGWDALFKAAYNGFSEFANEMSAGLVILLFNWVMITRLGVEGVAAFTIIGYLLMIGIEVSYGVSESLQPTVSKNLGARQPDRIARFAVAGCVAAFAVGLGAAALFIFLPETLVSFFLAEGENATEQIALSFIALFWPAFLFNGMNITLASVFTAMHKPIQSAVIALSRSLVLPALGLLLLPRWLGDTGIFITVPLAEALTFLIALALARTYRPSAIVAELDLPPKRQHESIQDQRNQEES